MDGILNSQRPSSNKVGLGYDHKENNEIKTNSNQHRSSLYPKRNDYKRNTTPRRTPPKRVQGYDHRNTKCSSNQRSRNYNSFSPLLDYNIECYKCNNYNHKASDCRLLKESMKTGTSNIQEEHKKIWK